MVSTAPSMMERDLVIILLAALMRPLNAVLLSNRPCTLGRLPSRLCCRAARSSCLVSPWRREVKICLKHIVGSQRTLGKVPSM